MSLANEIIFGTLTRVERLICSGADIEAVDEYGFPPLIETTIANKPEITALLLRHGADSNCTDVTGRSALHWAVDNGNLSICQLLLEHKANPNAHTLAGQPVLLYPLLRQQSQLKRLLYQYGANLNFAQDFINVKLLGHRYELKGQVDIVNAEGHFIPINYEGFFLEFTLNVIYYSLKRYCNHFSARQLRPYFHYLGEVLCAFKIASELLKYQSYTLDIQQYTTTIDALLEQKILFLPLAYEGHAISLIRYKDLLVYCDRGNNSDRDGTVVVYRIQKLQCWTSAFIKQLLYKRLNKAFITQTFYSLLGLVPVERLPIEAQLSGNCSWANVEASIPAMLFLLQLQSDDDQQAMDQYKVNALTFYQAWLAWDKDRALEECIKGFPYANKVRKATKASMLGAVLFQKCRYNCPQDLAKVERILPILTLPEYKYVLKSYLKVYWHDKKTVQGKNLIQLLDNGGVRISME